jgi:hypothetical protein
MDRQKAMEKKLEKRDKAEGSRAMDEKKDGIKSRGVGGVGRSPIERRPGGCPEGPPCIDSR